VIESAATSGRFVVVAPVGRDGELICNFLTGCGFCCEQARSIREAWRMDPASILGLILTDEAISRGGMEPLLRMIHSQPAWSDLPVMLLTSGSAEASSTEIARRVRLAIRSLILLDRPVRKELLVSAAQMAFTSRQQQWKIRDAAWRQTESEEALRHSEKLAATGRLVATMAHEVNNPLAALGNILYLVEHSNNLEEARSYGSLAARELDRISAIIQQTLTTHRAPAEPTAVDLSDLALSALMLFRGRLRERHILESTALERTFACCSEGEVRQALVNLIGNAIDAMPEGGRLRIHVSPVPVNGVRLARVTVGDTGSGIPQEIRSSLFSQFFTTKGSRGTGLGLWLTRDIVHRNRGSLRFRSRTSRPGGTVFSIYLPAAQTPDLGKVLDLQSPGQEAAEAQSPARDHGPSGAIDLIPQTR
jgi:signal transduction histidine kinase